MVINLFDRLLLKCFTQKKIARAVNAVIMKLSAMEQQFHGLIPSAAGAALVLLNTSILLLVFLCILCVYSFCASITSCEVV